MTGLEKIAKQLLDNSSVTYSLDNQVGEVIGSQVIFDRSDDFVIRNNEYIVVDLELFTVEVFDRDNNLRQSHRCKLSANDETAITLAIMAQMT